MPIDLTAKQKRYKSASLERTPKPQFISIALGVLPGLECRAGTGLLIMDAYITADFPGWAHELKHDSY